MRKPKKNETEEHYAIHSIVPAFSCFSSIQKLSIDGIRTGRTDLYVDIKGLADEGMGILKELENELKKGL
jgi:hypothetical protein